MHEAYASSPQPWKHSTQQTKTIMAWQLRDVMLYHNCYQQPLAGLRQLPQLGELTTWTTTPASKSQ
jgi:hypothetical protein